MNTSIVENEVVLATFHLDGIHFALDTTQIREAIILDKEIVPLPSSADFVEGVMDLRGTIVPLINLKKRLGRPDTGYATDCRAAIVVLQGITLGILFDGVKDVIRIPRDEIVRLNEALQGEDTVVDGLVNHTESGRIIEIIEPSLLVSPEQRECFGTVNDTHGGTQEEALETGRTRQIVVFAYHGQEFGVELDYVKEVETVADVDTAFKGKLISGAVSIHGDFVPLIRLDSLGNNRRGPTAVDETALSNTGNVLVLNVDDAVFAVTIDQVREMLTVRESQLSCISLGNNGDRICYAQLQGDRSIQIIEAPSAFGPHVRDIRSLNNVYRRDSLAAISHTARSTKKDGVTETSYLFFEAGERFALHTSSIQEILPNVNVVSPLFSHEHLEGVINLRQTTLPVFDLNSYLGLARSTDRDDEEQRIIVLKEKDRVVVLRVDRVLKLVSNTRETALPPLGEALSRNRALFKSMLISKDDTGMTRHVLRLDSDALVGRLTTLEVGDVERVKDV